MEASPLARLPAELRNRIYEVILVYDNPTWIAVYLMHARLFRQRSSRPRHVLALVLTCKQLNAEAGSLHYALNTFTLYHDVSLRKWCYAIGERNTKDLRTVIVDLGLFSPKSWNAHIAPQISNAARSARLLSTRCNITVEARLEIWEGLDGNGWMDFKVHIDLRNTTNSLNVLDQQARTQLEKVKTAAGREAMEAMEQNLETLRTRLSFEGLCER